MPETLRDIEFNREASEEKAKERSSPSPDWKPGERVVVGAIEDPIEAFQVYQQDSKVGWFNLHADEIPFDVEHGDIFDAEIEDDMVVWMQFNPEVTKRAKERLEERYDDAVTTVDEDYENVDRGE